MELARRAEKERLLSGGSEDYAQTRTHVIEGAHPAAIICCKLLPGAEQVLTGSGAAHAQANRRLAPHAFHGSRESTSPSKCTCACDATAIFKTAMQAMALCAC